jgi:hypothetical protein
MAHHFPRRSLVFCCALLCSPLIIEIGASATTTTLSAASVIAAAKSALAKQTGVHLELASTSGTTKDEVKADFGTKAGIEVIVTGKATATVKVTPTYGYISGNSLGLTSVVGLSATQAKRVGTRWISLKAGSTQYRAVTSGTTISSLTSVLPVAKSTTVTSTSQHGVKVNVLVWTTPATSSSVKTLNTLVIAANGPALPIKETATASTGSGTTTFSKWGESVHVASPSSSAIISYAAVTA